MSARLPRLACVPFFACVLSLAMLFGTASPSRAEPSSHKLKRKLHKLEKKSGKVVDVVSDITLFTGVLTYDAAVIGVAICLQVDIDELPLIALNFGGEHKFSTEHASRMDEGSHHSADPKSHSSSKEHSK
jgi:hypothetical protein